jgi:hypothetical protein
MADHSPASTSLDHPKPESRAITTVKTASSWLIPVITVLVLVSAFSLYYFVYVPAQREYLANRNFRSLAVLGEQIQATISNNGSVLEYYADLAGGTKNPTTRDIRKKETLNQFLVVHPEDKTLPKDEQLRETLKDYLRYLAPGFELTETPAGTRRRFEAQRRNGRWELVLTAQKHAGAKRDYMGVVEVDSIVKPLAGSLPFDNILLVSETGTMVYQGNKSGPQFTSLADLLQTQTGTADSKTADGGSESHSDNHTASNRNGAISRNEDPAWRARSMHLTDVQLAGTHYKLFLQPVLVDVFSDDPGQDEPAREWVLCGLRSATALELEALSISSTFIIWFIALFLAICMSSPVLKVLFMNHRERLHLRELGFLGLFLVLLTGVFTLSGLQAVGFPLNDDTQAQLKRLGDQLSVNMHDELRQMRNQLTAWCRSPQLRKDLKAAESQEIVRNSQAEVDPTPAPSIYPYLNNVFWTDDDGHQIVKWSATGYLTPMADVSHLDIYTHPKTTDLDGKGPPFHFDSVVPPNRLEHLAVMGINTADCNPALVGASIRGDVTGGSAFLSAQPLSLIDPILPYGYGFALLDETGVVRFHSDKNKNLRENFLQESDWNKQLSAAAFGHSTERSLSIKYMGKDYRARVIPVSIVSQAPWSLIVYRDTTSVRTLNLQAMTMASTLFLAILAGPVLIAAIWCAIRRPRFAPDWLWPNPGRADAYKYQIAIYASLIVLFLFLGFTGPSQRNIMACLAMPYAAFLLTVWCFRSYPRRRGPKKPSARNTGGSYATPAGLTILSVFFLVLAIFWQRAHPPVSRYWLGLGIFAAFPLLDRRRRYFAVRLSRSFRTDTSASPVSGSPETDLYAWRKYYTGSLITAVLLFGVLTPMALFRASLDVERRLGVKQAQLHLASALGERLLATGDLCEKGQLSEAACAEFKRPDSDIWGKIVLSPIFPADGRLPVVLHSFRQQGGELYSGWFQDVLYSLHHDYNQTAAEMLGVIQDRIIPKSDGNFPDWSWENKDSVMTLRWHGVHFPIESHEVESDLLLASSAPASPWNLAFAGAGVAAGVILAIGLLVVALVRRVFLFHVAPLKITGVRRAEEAVREGRNVAILIPPLSTWQLDGPKWTLDLAEVATGPKWAELFDLNTAPVNTVIEILHFEYSANDAEIDNQKFLLIDQLLRRENTRIAVVMTAPVSTEDYSRMFPALELIDLREEPFYWLKQYEGPARDMIWKECGPLSALWPIGAQLAKDITPEDAHSEETIASEILERADPYYRLIWKECSNNQRFALSQLAEDGLLNPSNERAIRQLVRRGLIATDPQFRIMNESFRRFLRSAATPDLRKEWRRESQHSGWGKVHGVFFTTMILLGAFLLTTQNALWQSSAAYVTTALGALGTLTRLVSTYRGGGTADKAS